MKDNKVQLSSQFSAQAVDAAIKIIMVLLMVAWCVDIVRPFIMPMTWGAIIAVALYPVTVFLSNKVKISQGKASLVVTLMGLAILLVPAVMFSGALFTSSQDFIHLLQEGQLKIPAPKASVADWPVIGELVYSTWSKAVNDLEVVAKQYSAQIKDTVMFLVGMLGGIGGSVLQFTISIIIAGVFMTNAQSCGAAFQRIAVRLAGHYGGEFAALSAATIRGVVQGVLGVAVIQAVLAGLGMAIVGVPATGIWMIGILVLAIIQLPPILLIGPIIMYVFSVESSTTATLFMIWGIAVSGCDTFIKPILMGRGVDIPMLVILLGAIGGMMMSGLIGLFVGAVALALGYKLLMAWLDLDDETIAVKAEDA
ncbi:AI-2E family transporter [Motilimonas cestriensis]|uniref:AI-2E family transporter n=1 Tax=Motilimonas cestriensis TaxID=2742685 RepID=A0ABS8W569_9GAMM|nr:AI-2E family transporter [Motilimonas cestriensis]MCE2593537.1 AI-2E family transporter [Motilimonas cestriensis]